MAQTATAPVLTTPEGWIVTRTKGTGRCQAVAIPSNSAPGKYHLVTVDGCDCKGFAYRQRCCHHAALRAFLVSAEREAIAYRPVMQRLIRYA